MQRESLTSAEHTVLSVVAYSYMQHARYREAAMLLETLDAMQPGNARTLRGLTLAQLRHGKPNKALRTLDRLAMAGGTDAAFHLLRSQVLVALSRPLEAGVAMRSFVQLRSAARKS